MFDLDRIRSYRRDYFLCSLAHFAARRLAVFLDREECAWTDARFAIKIVYTRHR